MAVVHQAGGSHRPRLGAVAAGALVFLTSAAVLVLEILAGRLLAPYVGVTLQTYTGIIGTVLAGIALGTWLGGLVADRVDPGRVLGPAILLGGALSLLTVPVVRWLGEGWADGGAGAIVGLSFVGFFAPAVVLSTVPPLVIKLELRDLGETGAVVGRLSALGTAGAIAGTFVAGFVLVGLAPTSALIPGIGVSLTVGGLAVWIWLSRADRSATGAIAVVALLGLVATAATGGNCDVETEYYCARVELDPDRPSGRLLVLDDLRHSYVDLTDPTHLEFRYIQAFAAAIDGTRDEAEPLDVLHVGGGGLTMPRWLRATRPGSTGTVLELDPGIVELAEERLGFVPGPDVEIRTGDARLGLRRLPDDAYDVVLGDAFGGVAVPWHLTTVEVVRDLRRVLRHDGLYAVNVIDRGPLGFARAELATLAAVFDEVAVVATPVALSGYGGNLVLLASDAPIDTGAVTDALRRLRTTQDVLSGPALDALIADARPLTDDHAPVDQLITT
jgi:spermidine synthase/MFS family permease